MARLVSRAEIARVAGVSAMAISKACNGKLKPACVGRRVDLDHPAVAEYVGSKGRTVPAPAKAAKKAPPKQTAPHPPRAVKRASQPEQDAESVDGTDDDLESLAELLRPLVERFGTATRFRDWLVALKTIEEIRAKRLDNEEHEGLLIERELVQVRVFGAMDATNRRLLQDFPKTVARELYAQARAGVSHEELEKIVRNMISAQLRQVKTQASRALMTTA